jgi:branched-subunit amino acid transport protein
METLYLVTGMALVTFFIRYGLLPLSGRINISGGMRNALRYVPPVVLTAIIVPAVFYPNGHTFQISPSNAYLVGAVATAVIGKLSKNLLITIVSGMACFALWQWILKMM